MRIKAREKWKKITELVIDGELCKFKHNIYVSNYGKVRRYYKEGYTDANGNPYIELSQYKASKGYSHRVVALSIKGQKDQKKVRVHRLVATLFVENPKPEKYDIINHIDGDPTNNYYKNLEWTDTQGNALHAYNTGLTKVPSAKMYGESNSMATHTTEEILKIKDMMLSGMANSEIVTITGLDRSYISKIRTGKRWGKITGFGNNNVLTQEEYQSIGEVPRATKRLILSGITDSDEIIKYIKENYKKDITKEYVRKIKYRIKIQQEKNGIIKL